MRKQDFSLQVPRTILVWFLAQKQCRFPIKHSQLSGLWPGLEGPFFLEKEDMDFCLIKLRVLH